MPRARSGASRSACTAQCESRGLCAAGAAAAHARATTRLRAGVRRRAASAWIALPALAPAALSEGCARWPVATARSITVASRQRRAGRRGASRPRRRSSSGSLVELDAAPLRGEYVSTSRHSTTARRRARSAARSGPGGEFRFLGDRGAGARPSRAVAARRRDRPRRRAQRDLRGGGAAAATRCRSGIRARRARRGRRTSNRRATRRRAAPRRRGRSERRQPSELRAAHADPAGRRRGAAPARGLDLGRFRARRAAERRRRQHALRRRGVKAPSGGAPARRRPRVRRHRRRRRLGPSPHRDPSSCGSFAASARERAADDARRRDRQPVASASTRAFAPRDAASRAPRLAGLPRAACAVAAVGAGLEAAARRPAAHPRSSMPQRVARRCDVSAASQAAEARDGGARPRQRVIVGELSRSASAPSRHRLDAVEAGAAQLGAAIGRSRRSAGRAAIAAGRRRHRRRCRG